MSITTIAIDIMGGDFAPRELILGAIRYLESGGEAKLLLVGRGDAVREVCATLPDRCELVDTPEMVEMGEAPAQALRHAWHGCVQFESRLDTIDIWEVSLDQPPVLRITGREIVWAGWMDPSAALGRRLLPHIAAYLAQRSQEGQVCN